MMILLTERFSFLFQKFIIKLVTIIHIHTGTYPTTHL